MFFPNLRFLLPPILTMMHLSPFLSAIPSLQNVCSKW